MSAPQDGRPDDATDEDGGGTGPWGYALGAAVAVAVAVACFTPLWDEVADPGSRRCGFFVDVLTALTPFGVAGIALAIAAVLGVLAVRGFRRPE